MKEEEDVLLRALRELPKPDVGTGAAQDRARREARAAFERAKSGGGRSFDFGSFAVPAVLAGVIFIYLGWAISAVNALAH